MERGFDFEVYGEKFKNCFIETSYYKNGNLQLSLYGLDSKVNQIAHIAEVSLNQDKVKLPKNEIIVDTNFRPQALQQLEKLGILEEQLRFCIIGKIFYPIYKINFSKLKENSYYMQELIAA